jgi:antitoxin HicB
MIYLIDIEPDDGSLLATSRAFPELTTFGADRDEVARNAIGAIEEAIAARIDDGLDLPAPASANQARRHKGVAVKLPLMTALKAMLYTSLRKAGITRAELARRLGWHREQVDRLFRLDHASKTDQIEAAFRALEQDIDVQVTKRAEAAA